MSCDGIPFFLSLQKIFIMASNPNFVQYIADQCEGAGEIVDDRDYMSELVKTTCKELTLSKPKRHKKP